MLSWPVFIDYSTAVGPLCRALYLNPLEMEDGYVCAPGERDGASKSTRWLSSASVSYERGRPLAQPWWLRKADVGYIRRRALLPGG